MYKFSNKEHTKVMDLITGTTGIHPGVWRWEKYEEWVDAGGVTEPYKTDEEKLQERLERNKQKAIDAQLRAIKKYEQDDLNSKYGLLPLLTSDEKKILKGFIKAIAIDIESPSLDEDYNPEGV